MCNLFAKQTLALLLKGESMQRPRSRQHPHVTKDSATKAAQPMVFETMEGRLLFNSYYHGFWMGSPRYEGAAGTLLPSTTVAPPVLVSASSNQIASDPLNPGNTVIYPINLPLNVPNHSLPGIEDRTDSFGHPIFIAMVFSTAITASNFSVEPLVDIAGVPDGTASTPTVDPSNPNQLDIPVTGWLDKQTMLMTLSYSGPGGPSTYTVKIGFLLGDVTDDGTVNGTHGYDNGTDFAAFAANFGMLANATNFRSDFDGDGVINGTNFALLVTDWGTNLFY
jgi:hypothetical protein